MTTTDPIAAIDHAERVAAIVRDAEPWQQTSDLAAKADMTPREFRRLRAIADLPQEVKDLLRAGRFSVAVAEVLAADLGFQPREKAALATMMATGNAPASRRGVRVLLTHARMLDFVQRDDLVQGRLTTIEAITETVSASRDHTKRTRWEQRETRRQREDNPSAWSEGRRRALSAIVEELAATNRRGDWLLPEVHPQIRQLALEARRELDELLAHLGHTDRPALSGPVILEGEILGA